MCKDTFHHPLGKTASAELRQDKDVRQIGKSRAIGDHAGKPDLLLAAIHPKTERITDRLLYRVPRNAKGPIALSKKAMHGGNIDSRRIGADLKISVAPSASCCRHQLSLSSATDARVSRSIAAIFSTRRS